MKRIKNLIAGTFLLILILTSVFSISSIVNAEKGGTHNFKEGLMAEIFEGLESSEMSTVTTNYLSGEWACNSYSSNKYAQNPLLDSNWGLAGEDLCLQFLGGNLIFADDGDGTTSVSTTTQDPMFMVTTNPTMNSPYIIVGDNIHRKVFYVYGGDTYSFDIIYHIKKINQNQMILTLIDGSDFCPKSVLCDRVLGPQ